MYSIFDLETTGFSPSRGDRIIEIGIIKIDEDDQIVDTYSTLVNPKRDISNSQVHGIKPSIVKNAPTFQEVSPFIRSFLNKSTLVAHNASFDLRFLNSELPNLNKNLTGICTLQLSRIVDKTLSCRKLDFLCNYYNIKIENSHQALSDAIATTQLFIKLKNEFSKICGYSRFRQQFATPVSFDYQREDHINRIEYSRNEAFKHIRIERTKLQKVIYRLPTESLSQNANSTQYIDTLTEILADRVITRSELIKLEDLIDEFGLSKDQISALHKKYLAEVIKIYLLDGKISEFELSDIKALTQLLCLKQSDVDELIKTVAHQTKSSNSKHIGHKNALSGKSVCFTGQLQSKLNGTIVERSLAQEIAHQHGLIIKKNVSKKLDYLITSDPNSMSGKAKKAREYGLKILAEAEFWKLLGVNVE